MECLQLATHAPCHSARWTALPVRRQPAACAPDCDRSYNPGLSPTDTIQICCAARDPGPVSLAAGAELFANAKCREDAIEDVVGGGGSGDGVDGAERPIEIEQQHFVRDFFRYRAARFGEVF